MSEHAKFSDAELLERASLRVTRFIRGMWEEKGDSDSRLLLHPWMPDRLTTMGRSRACAGKVYREHVVPRVLIVREAHRMFAEGHSDDEVALYIRDHVKIVEITKEEADRLDRKADFNLKKTMPEGWQAGGDVYARLAAAGIEWEPKGPLPPP